MSQDVARQHAAMLAPLSAGRVNITAVQIGYLRMAVSIAIRWGCVPWPYMDNDLF